MVRLHYPIVHGSLVCTRSVRRLLHQHTRIWFMPTNIGEPVCIGYEHVGPPSRQAFCGTSGCFLRHFPVLPSNNETTDKNYQHRLLLRRAPCPRATQHAHDPPNQNVASRALHLDVEITLEKLPFPRVMAMVVMIPRRPHGLVLRHVVDRVWTRVIGAGALGVVEAQGHLPVAQRVVTLHKAASAS